MAEKISLNIEGKSLIVSKSVLEHFTYFESVLERWHSNGEPIFIDCDHKLFRHLLNIARIPNYNIPATELDNIMILADYYGLKINIPKCPEPKCPKPNIITSTLYDLSSCQERISEVKHMVFHNIRLEDIYSETHNYRPEPLKIDFDIIYVDSHKKIIIREDIFMHPHREKPILVDRKVIHSGFLPLFQETFTISSLPRNKLTENVWVTILC
jgi:hypothetical protein